MVATGAIAAVFLAAFRYSRMVASRTILEHAASRAARAKAVGFNDFMCAKTARAAMIPVAGRRLWPQGKIHDEASMVPIYLESADGSRAAGVLDYDNWHRLKISTTSGTGLSPAASAKLEMQTEDFRVRGEAKIESHFPLYMNAGGF